MKPRAPTAHSGGAQVSAETPDPDDLGVAAADRFGKPQRRRRGPFHAGDAGHPAELLDRVEPDAVVAQIEHQRQAFPGLGNPLHVGDDAARRDERVGRLVHHEGRGAGGARGAGEGAGVVDRAPDPGEERHAPGDLLGDGMDHGLGFGARQPVELAGVAVRHQDVDAGPDRPVDDRLKAPRRDAVLIVEGRHEDAGDSGQGGAKLGVDLRHGSLLGSNGGAIAGFGELRLRTRDCCRGLNRANDAKMQRRQGGSG